MDRIRAAITGVSCWVPDDLITNFDLEKIVDTSDEWIKTRTGISKRHILKGKGLGTSDIATPAVLDLLEKTKTKPEEVELLICCTVTPDFVFPATSNVITDKAGLVNAWGYDLNAACSGFIYGLVTASNFIESGTYKKVIVVGADKMSSIIDYQNRETCVIFGDGGGAVLLEPSKDDTGIQDSIMRSDGSGRHYLHQKAGGSVRPASHETVDAREHYVYQEGTTVFKFAVTKMADVAVEIMKNNNLKPDDVTWLAPHQANLRIIEATGRRMGIPKERVMINIENYGNTTNGTIPLLLWEYEKNLKKGDNIIIAAFGGGFTWGSLFLKWSYDSK